MVDLRLGFRRGPYVLLEDVGSGWTGEGLVWNLLFESVSWDVAACCGGQIRQRQRLISSIRSLA